MFSFYVFLMISRGCPSPLLLNDFSLKTKLNNLSPPQPVYFYNFGWEDYGVSNSANILDMMKVMVFAMQEGKIAVHCHAGLGRTGAEI